MYIEPFYINREVHSTLSVVLNLHNPMLISPLNLNIHYFLQEYILQLFYEDYVQENNR
jgi:hypothetical protein